MQVDTGQEIIIISTLYRPTTIKSSLPQIDKEINKNIKAAAKFTNTKKRNRGLLITGDFNFADEITWLDDGSSQVQTNEHSPGQIFIDMLENESLTQNVKSPTFQRADGQINNTLDLIISDTPERISELAFTAPLGKTKQGHLCLTWNYHLSQPIKQERTSSIKFALKKGNYDKINQKFIDQNWDELFNHKTTNECYNLFQEKYNEACEEFIPKKSQQSIRQRAPWMNNVVLNIIKKKRKLHYQLQSNRFKSSKLVEEYHNKCIEADKISRITVKKFEEDLANDRKNPKRLYQYIKSKQKVNTQISSLLIDGKLIVEGTEIANALNNQFKSVFISDSNSSAPPDFVKRTKESLSNISFTQEKVLKYLNTLQAEKAQGNDKINPFVILKCTKTLAYPISIIFQRSFDQGELPNAWLEANVTPLFKKGSRLDPSNYRPISLTSILCKVMEKMIKDELMQYLNKNSLINKQQHGFVNNKACNTNLLETIDLLTKLLADKESFDLLLLDFAKAFDVVSHQRLLIKLEAYGINGNLLLWLKAFLKNRRQRVVLGDHFSNWVEVISGVIQGSSLGPVLFIIYINDLVEIIVNKSKLFADDTNIISKIDNENHLNNNLQVDIDRVLDWTKDWLIRLNIDKCKVMHFGKNIPT